MKPPQSFNPSLTRFITNLKHPLIHPQYHGKLASHAFKCIFLGYSTTQKDTCFYPCSLKAYHITFFENKPFFLNAEFQENKHLCL